MAEQEFVKVAEVGEVAGSSWLFSVWVNPRSEFRR